MRGLHGSRGADCARPSRTGLTTVGVASGAVLYAGLINAGVTASIDRAVDELVGRADMRVAALGENGLSDAAVVTIEGTTGVVMSAPSFERRTYLGAAPFGPGPLPAPVSAVGSTPSVSRGSTT